MKNNKEKIKQAILVCISIILIFVGCFNYNFETENKDDTFAKEERNESTLGDVQLVNAEPIIANSAIVPNEELEVSEKEENSIESKQENEIQNKDNYYEETKLERNRMYSEMLEIYQNLIDSPETPQDQKAIAAKEISNINKRKNGIMISENLIKNKGFEDVVILVNENTVSVVVKAYTLSQEQISKIQNIIERELEVGINNINISNKF